MEKNHYFESPVIASSGLMGIVGEGYKYQKILKIFLPILYSFKWITFQTKTITSWERKGNMRLSEKDEITPVDFHPHCIYVNFWKGYGVSNVSLSNPGILSILEMNILQKIKGELHLSVMLTSTDPKKRIVEVNMLASFLKWRLKEFKSKKIFLHWNISCPNTGHNGQKFFLESFMRDFKFLKELELPIILKVGWNFPINILLGFQKEKMIFGVDAINTIPFNELPSITKRRYFKRNRSGHFISPLDKYQNEFRIKGRGGVSGNPIRSYALKWIRKARKAGVTLPIIGGGGILWPWHVWQFKKAGATAISPGSISFLRPWNLLLVTLTALLIFRRH